MHPAEPTYLARRNGDSEASNGFTARHDAAQRSSAHSMPKDALLKILDVAASAQVVTTQKALPDSFSWYFNGLKPFINLWRRLASTFQEGWPQPLAIQEQEQEQEQEQY
jgi:hypothetical protein